MFECVGGETAGQTGRMPARMATLCEPSVCDFFFLFFFFCKCFLGSCVSNPLRLRFRSLMFRLQTSEDDQLSSVGGRW